MENVSSNFTHDLSQHQILHTPVYLTVLSLIDIIPFLAGQPVIAKLLWISFTSKKATDILNFNLALFHNLQYCISIVHLFVLFLLPEIQKEILNCLFVYAQIGGPMNLSFICMERYVAVIYPTSYPLLKKYRFREVCAVAVWFVSVPNVFLLAFSVDTPSSLSENINDIFPVSLMVAMTVMVVHFSVRIAQALKKSGPGRDKMHPGKRRAFKTVCATLCMALICYTPVTILQRFGSSDETLYHDVIIPLCVFLLSAASVVHPLFYLSTQGKLFSCLKREKKAR